MREDLTSALDERISSILAPAVRGCNDRMDQLRTELTSSFAETSTALRASFAEHQRAFDAFKAEVTGDLNAKFTQLEARVTQMATEAQADRAGI